MAYGVVFAPPNSGSLAASSDPEVITISDLPANALVMIEAITNDDGVNYFNERIIAFATNVAAPPPLDGSPGGPPGWLNGYASSTLDLHWGAASTTTLVLYRDKGWFNGVIFQVTVYEIVVAGSDYIDQFQNDNASVTAPAPPDPSDAVITLESPIGAIHRFDEIVFTVVGTGVGRLPFVVKYTGGVTDLLWDGNDWGAFYSICRRAAIMGGYRYYVRRIGGWPLKPTIEALPVPTP